VELVLHAGDLVAPFALKAFGGLSAPLRGVFGNCDGEKIFLLQTAKQLGYSLHSSPYHFELEGRSILLMHEPFELEALAASQYYDLIVYGHLHKPALYQEGKTLVLSPGEGGGWLSRKKTVALLGLDQMQAEIVEI
jgi:putative phosphoesterase